MNKKSYTKPQMKVFTLKRRQHILSGSARNLVGNSGIKMGGGSNGSGIVRSRGFDDDWFDE